MTVVIAQNRTNALSEIITQLCGDENIYRLSTEAFNHIMLLHWVMSSRVPDLFKMIQILEIEVSLHSIHPNVMTIKGEDYAFRLQMEKLIRNPLVFYRLAVTAGRLIAKVTDRCMEICQNGCA